MSIYFCFSFSSGNAPAPAYEEIRAGAFQGRLKKVDRALYEALYRNGTPEKDIFFVDVEPRRRKGRVWDFTELSVRCSDKDSAARLLKTLSREIAASGRGVRFKDRILDRKSIACRIYIEDCLTHRVTLSFDSQGVAEKKGKPRVAVIIDDMGYDPQVASAFARIPEPLCFSVLPSAPYTGEIADEAFREGKELLLHLPMEPKDYPKVTPGPGALLLSMDDQELRKTLDRDLSQVPGACGVNHHMGSSFTENRAKMLVVLGELRKRNLFYIDSRTTKDTQALVLAKELGVPAARRRVFLDNDLDPEAIKMQFKRLMSMARHRGAAIGIGHAHKETAVALGRLFREMDGEIEIVPVSELVER